MEKKLCESSTQGKPKEWSVLYRTARDKVKNQKKVLLNKKSIIWPGALKIKKKLEWR